MGTGEVLWFVHADTKLQYFLGVDPERIRARVWSPRTLLFYAQAGRERPGPADAPTDVRPMGGDAVVVGGVAVDRWRPRTPVGRVDPAVLVAAAHGLLG